MCPSAYPTDTGRKLPRGALEGQKPDQAGRASRLGVARRDAEHRDHLRLVGVRVGHVGARAAAEPGAGLIVAHEDTGVAPALAVLNPHRVALLEPVYGSALGLVGLVAHAPETNRCPANRPCERQTHGVSEDETPSGLVIRPLARGDEAALLRNHRAREVKRWWDEPEDGFPWEDDPDSTRLVIEVEGAVAGLIQFYEEPTPKYRYAAIDLFLDPALHGRGLGTETVRRVVRDLIEDRGHHRITVDPATTNAVAIRVYEKVGFKPVGVMRRYERDTTGDGWHDGLLMELLADEL